nr:hypothetical protein [Tanacetum cinerariifolium]
DADEEDEEQDEDDDDDEEEHPASADSIPPPPALHVTARISFRPTSPSILPIPLHAASPPLQLLSSNRKADRPAVTMPPRKRLSIVYCPGYEAGESSVAAAARPIKGRRADYGFIDSVEAEIRRRRVEDIRYDPRDVAEEEALTTLEGINTREARCSREAWAHSIRLSSTVPFELQGYITHMWVQDQHIDAQDTLIVTLATQLSSPQGHFKRYCPKLKNNNNNRGNQVGTGNAQARVYTVGNTGKTRMRTPLRVRSFSTTAMLLCYLILVSIE